MEKIIQSYNNIIEHKHQLSKNNEVKVEEIFGQQSEEIGNKTFFENIKTKKVLLLSADLNQQIKLNKQMVKEYRLYRQKLDTKIAEESVEKNTLSSQKDQERS